MRPGSILDIGATGAFPGAHCFEKRPFSWLASPKKMSLLNNFNENFFFKLHDTKLGLIVAPNKGLTDWQFGPELSIFDATSYLMTCSNNFCEMLRSMMLLKW